MWLAFRAERVITIRAMLVDIICMTLSTTFQGPTPPSPPARSGALPTMSQHARSTAALRRIMASLDQPFSLATWGDQNGAGPFLGPKGLPKGLPKGFGAFFPVFARFGRIPSITLTWT